MDISLAFTPEYLFCSACQKKKKKKKRNNNRHYPLDNSFCQHFLNFLLLPHSNTIILFILTKLILIFFYHKDRRPESQSISWLYKNRAK